MDQPPLIPAPNDPKDWPAWRDGLSKWKAEARTGYDGSAYDKPEFEWMQRCFAFGKVMLFDRQFLHHVDDWLDQQKEDFGGLDALCLWQAYPRIGVDQRNQFDHYREFPGGLKPVVDHLHANGVKVVLAYNPWDVGTRREGKSDADAMAEMVKDLGFDGIFLDTLTHGAAGLRQTIDQAKPGVVLESELALPLDAVDEHHASWAQWFDDSQAPGVLRNKWFEQRHQMHTIRRWDLDHSGELQMSWMNGAGIFVWQNIFGSWNGWSDRDKAILRAMSPIQRRYWRHFSRGLWTPLVETSQPGMYASKWSLDGVDLWTVVNREQKEVEGFVQGVASDGSHRLFDLVHGKELDHAQIKLGPRGIGAIFHVPSRLVDKDLGTFLESQARMHARYSPNSSRVEPMIVRVGFEKSAKREAAPGAVTVEAGERKMVTRFRVRECGEYGYATFTIPWAPGLHSHRLIERNVRVGKAAVELREVTNAEFAEFLKATGYKPDDDASFLKHWENGAPKPGDESKPVVYVSLDDARAYAKWAGKRLPTEDEMQLSGLVSDGVWNWTESEHTDGRTAFSLLKGQSKHRAEGSHWYFDGGEHPADWTAKFIHFWPGLDRCGTIGFRCAVDLN